MAAIRFLKSNLAKTLLNKAHIHTSVGCQYRRKDTPIADDELKKSLGQHVPERKYEQAKFPGEFNIEPPKGKIYDKKPFKVHLEAGKRYNWCTCGRSKNQPFCDGQHKQLDGTAFVKTQRKFRPLRFIPEETKEYWLCNCKRTSNAPFCDGTHKREDIQDAVR